jgi:beta-1,4-N-acetylglucosaminyltransferase
MSKKVLSKFISGENMKICIVCSHGGHMTQTMQILEAFEEHEIFFVTYHSVRDTKIQNIAHTYFTDNLGTSIWRMFKAIFWAFRILNQEHPNVILSLGAEIALPFIYIGKVLRIKTIFIESWSRVENVSRTGKLVYFITDDFLVQWPQLLDKCGSEAHFEGSVI